MEQRSTALQSGDMGATAPGELLCRARFFQRGSGAFRLLERIFKSDGQQNVRPTTASERKTMSRLVKAGLVIVSRKKHEDCGCTCIRYSLTLAGRACYVAADMGLSFHQLCYLVFARAAKRRSIITGKPEFYTNNISSTFSMLFPSVSPHVTRKELTKKGFLVKHGWHTSGMSARFAELERHAAVVDELYVRMREEDEERLMQAMQDPSIAKIVSHFF